MPRAADEAAATSAASAPTPASGRRRRRSTRTPAATSPPTTRATARAGRTPTSAWRTSCAGGPSRSSTSPAARAAGAAAGLERHAGGALARRRAVREGARPARARAGRRGRARPGDARRHRLLERGRAWRTRPGCRARTAARRRALEPVRLRRRGGTCRAARGRTIVASGSVRVFETGDGRFACRVGGRRPVRARGLVGAADRRRPLAARVRRGHRPRASTSRTGRAVTRARPVSQATLLRDGTLAWIELGGRLMARSPGRRRRRALGRGAGRARRRAPRGLLDRERDPGASTGRRARPGRPRSPGS